MSRSIRKTPISGIAGTSDKEDKRLANRHHRRINKQLAEDSYRALREVSNVWTMAKDGKRWFDSARYPELMRK
tara:strand:+ start:3929 stop:4147 length:219 start_codon:yes stop_codon:yes gene_type:complete